MPKDRQKGLSAPAGSPAHHPEAVRTLACTSPGTPQGKAAGRLRIGATPQGPQARAVSHPAGHQPRQPEAQSGGRAWDGDPRAGPECGPWQEPNQLLRSHLRLDPESWPGGSQGSPPRRQGGQSSVGKTLELSATSRTVDASPKTPHGRRMASPGLFWAADGHGEGSLGPYSAADGRPHLAS